jgi:hypothetical protein
VQGEAEASGDELDSAMIKGATGKAGAARSTEVFGTMEAILAERRQVSRRASHVFLCCIERLSLVACPRPLYRPG